MGGGRGGGGRGRRVRGQGGCERRSEVFVKIQKKMGGGVGGGIGGGGPIRGWGGGGEVARFAVGGDVGYGGCKPRLKGIDKCKKRFCTILRIIKMIKRGGVGAGG